MKKSSYQKLKDKIEEIEKTIYNMAQEDDLILAKQTMLEKRMDIDLNKVVWKGDTKIFNSKFEGILNVKAYMHPNEKAEVILK